jgi:replicative DNA helicase
MASAALNLINSVCKDKDIYLILSEDPEIFGEYEDVAKELKDYYNKHRSVPSIGVLQQINPDVEEVKVEATTSHYLEVMKADYVEGQINNLLIKTGKHLQAGNPSLVVLDGLQKQVAKLARLSTIVQDVDIMDVAAAREHYEEVKKIADANGGVVGIPTGFEGIDSAYTTGMAGGHLIYAMGFSGNGKSWFAGKMATQAWKRGVKAMIVSMEMTTDAMRNRIYTMMGEGQFQDSELGRGYYDKDTMDRFEQYAKDKPSFVVVAGTAGQDVTPNVVQAKIDQHQPGIVILDYQQLMMDNEKNQAITPRMTALSRELKLLAVNNNIPIIVISSVTDNDQGRNKPPTIEQIAWGRAMEFSADMVFAVHKIDDDMLEIVGRKNRFGSLWDMFLKVDFNSGIFKEIFERPRNDDEPDS